MLETFIPKLIEELQLGKMSLASTTAGLYTLPLEDGLHIDMTEISNGFMFKCDIAPYPKLKEEIFLTQAMLANLFGQGTKGAILGLNAEGSQLTLTLVIDYPTDYKGFKEALEDFINTMDLWHEEALNPSPLK